MDDNQKKNLHGRNAQVSLENILHAMMEQGYIVGFSRCDEWTKAGKMGYHLYAPFVLEFADGEQWALYYTSSLRERIKQDRWDSFLMKRFRNINHCYTVIFEKEPSVSGQVSDAEKADKLIQKARESTDAFPELDGAMTPTDLYNAVEQRYFQRQAHGVREAVAGTDFEARLSGILNSAENLAVWQGDELQIGREYHVFAQILTCWGCPRAGVASIEATTNIPKLPSGGLPKTDVLAIAHLVDGSELRFTASLKKSTGNYVSAHQYTAQAFCEALGVQDESLRHHLALFQEVGSERDANAEEPGFTTAFTAELQPYVQRLCEWVVSGTHGAFASPEQIADYVIAFDNESMTLEVCTAAAYIERMLRESSGQFGTPFRWTYASRRKGKDIQLKMPTFKPTSQVRTDRPAWPC